MRAVKALAAAIIVILYSGCVAPNDVKLASSQTVIALKSLSEAEASFRRLYLQEIDRTRTSVERSIVAVTVVQRVNLLAGDLEAKGNLIALSRELEATERGTRAMIDEVGRLTDVVESAGKAEKAAASEQTTARQSVRAAVQKYIDKKRDDLRATAALLPSGDPTRLELEARANDTALFDQRALERLYTILHLAAMRREAERNLVDLRGAIATLQVIHGQIDAWIQQDVTVSGESVAKLLDRAETLRAAGGRL
jgi:hypothetical protein